MFRRHCGHIFQVFLNYTIKFFTLSPRLLLLLTPPPRARPTHSPSHFIVRQRSAVRIHRVWREKSLQSHSNQSRLQHESLVIYNLEAIILGDGFWWRPPRFNSHFIVIASVFTVVLCSLCLCPSPTPARLTHLTCVPPEPDWPRPLLVYISSSSPAGVCCCLVVVLFL